MHEQVAILTLLFLGACATRNEDILVITHCVRMNVYVFLDVEAVACDCQSNL